MSADKKITVDELLVTPFSLRSEDEKCRIISDGRPTPLIKLLASLPMQETSSNKRTVYDELKIRHLKMSNVSKSLYDELKWMTASASTQKFYCWPCMLFQFQNPGVWNVSGFSDVSKLRAAAEEHALTEEHIEAMYQYQIFGAANVKTRGPSSACSKVNTDAIKRLTDVVITLASIQIPPKQLNNRLSELDVKQCMDSMLLLRKYDNVSKSSSDEAIKLLKSSPDIIKNLMIAIANTMRQAIAREIDSCKYISIILNQHSNENLKAQISTVLRYVVNGKVHERFIEFSHLFKSGTPESLYGHVMGIVKEFNIESKCIALSLDGAILYHCNVKKLVQPCQHTIRRCILVPCHSHRVDEVLQKALSSAHVKFSSFFKIMADFNACFWNPNSKLKAALDRFSAIKKMINVTISPRISSSDWFVAPDFICCVQTHRRHLMSFLEEVVSVDSQLSADDITKAIGFRKYLDDVLTVFMLNLFSEVFCATSALNAVLSDPSSERTLDNQLVPRLLINLNAMKTRDFKRLYTDVVKEINILPPKMKENKCYSLFIEALNVVIGEVEVRYSDVDKYKFCRLFDFEAGRWFEETSSRYKNLAEVYKMPYDAPQTLCEMELVSKHDAFSKKSVYDFHQYLHESNFKQAFEALFECSELILALPFKPASSTKEPSVKDKIERWSFGSAEEPYHEDTSIVFVESEKLLAMKQSPTFYKEVVANLWLGPLEASSAARRDLKNAAPTLLQS